MYPKAGSPRGKHGSARGGQAHAADDGLKQYLGSQPILRTTSCGMIGTSSGAPLEPRTMRRPALRPTIAKLRGPDPGEDDAGGLDWSKPAEGRVDMGPEAGTYRYREPSGREVREQRREEERARDEARGEAARGEEGPSRQGQQKAGRRLGRATLAGTGQRGTGGLRRVSETTKAPTS